MCKVKSIKIEIKGKDYDFTQEELVSLRDEILKLLPLPTYNRFPVPMYPPLTPATPSRPYWEPYIVYTGNT
jgi:hypothetical protein